MKRRLCGVHSVGEALAAHPRALALILVTDDGPKSPHREAIERGRQHGIVIEVRPQAELDSIADGLRHQGIIAISAEDYPYVDLDALLGMVTAPGLLVALDEITDVHNFGAIIRSCVALGAHGVITLKDRAAPVNSAVVRASAGATEHARIARVTNLSRALEQLKEADFQRVGLDAEGDHDLDAVDFTIPTVIVVGSEGRGLRRLVRERCNVHARIPMAGPLGSLNASVAAAITLYETRRQRLRAAY